MRGALTGGRAGESHELFLMDTKCGQCMPIQSIINLGDKIDLCRWGHKVCDGHHII
jgi:hypothetical protein